MIPEPEQQLILASARLIRQIRKAMLRASGNANLYHQLEAWEEDICQSVLDVLPEDCGYDVGFALNDALEVAYKEDP